MTGAQSQADFDFSFTLHLGVHGWMTAVFFLRDGPREYCASQVCGCPFSSLLKAATMLAEGAPSQDVEWFLEPDSVLLRFSARESQPPDISISCWEHTSFPAPRGRSVVHDPVWTVVVRLDYWLALVACEFRRITTLLKFPDHAANRRWEFSASKLALFEKAVRRRCGSNFLSGNLGSDLPTR